MNTTKTAFTSRNTPNAKIATAKSARKIDIEAVAAAVAPAHSRPPMAFPVSKYEEIAAMPGFPEALLYRLVIIPMKAPTKSAGGIEFSDDTMWASEVSCDVGYVARIGVSAFKDPRFYLDGAMPIKVGDWVNYGRLSGKDVIFRGTDGQEHRVHVCNDRDVLMLLPDPNAAKVYV